MLTLLPQEEIKEKNLASIIRKFIFGLLLFLFSRFQYKFFVYEYDLRHEESGYIFIRENVTGKTISNHLSSVSTILIDICVRCLLHTRDMAAHFKLVAMVLKQIYTLK